MLAKKFKLDKSDFSYIFKYGQKIKGGWFGIISKKNPKPKTQFSVIIPASVNKKVVLRNTLKREIYRVCEKLIISSQNGTQILIRVFRYPVDSEKKAGLEKIQTIIKDLLK